MHRHVVGVAKGTRISSALVVMRHARVSLAPVLDKGRLVGLLTKEIVMDGGNRGKRAEEVMLAPDAFVEEGMDLDQAAQILIRSKFSRLPVVDNRGGMHLLGMITATSIVKTLKE